MKNILCLLILFLIPFSNGYAKPNMSLYQASIPVNSQESVERAQATKDGLVQVLSKLTDDPAIADNPALKSSFEKAEYYVDEYSYLPAGNGYNLHIHFDSKSINGLLKRNRIAFWSESRPLVLLWISYKEDEQPTEYIGNENPSVLLNTFTTESKKHGLPLLFPMMDITDLDQMMADNMQTPPTVFVNASKRYSPNAILVGDIVVKEGKYQSEWKLITGEKVLTWSIKKNSISAIANEILMQTGKALAKQYVAVPEDAPVQPMELEVTNLTQKDDLVKLIKYLKTFALVQNVELVELKGTVVQLSLQIKGPLSAFHEATAISQNLIFKSEDLDNNKLWYEWVH